METKKKRFKVLPFLMGLLTVLVPTFIYLTFSSSQWGLAFAKYTLGIQNPVNFLLPFILVSVLISFSIAVYASWIEFKQSKMLETHNWLINATNWNIERLKAHGLIAMPQESDLASGVENANQNAKLNRWPWGSHHTDYLSHLDAAARKWWILYDPDDPTTAPTNEMVSDWLQSERHLSREKSRAIASMLRPDGLPTGPRK